MDIKVIEKFIKQDIIDQLTWDPAVDTRNVEVEVNGREVMLGGKVPNYAAKLAADRDAALVRGVKKVENHIDIQFPPTATIPQDEDITLIIEKLLFWNTTINAQNINVETQNGIVQLNGEVGSSWVKYLAGEAAKNTHGVVDVKNNLTVKRTKSILDIEIESDIQKAFKRSILIPERDINVSVKDGIAYLDGKTEAFFLKIEARNIAMNTAGVIDVVDKIEVE